ncbi:MFS transporter [Kineococcus xinjiangensis]|uniref:MFS transporter n=1 Tax=Kineococcus xinjiangensis TaxID=512762 RepID=A0A2S6IJ53_9ACTN|nr:MFS transporter [Kineococcus xinjiangensis]PPK94253.1 MFS transporter [Kineococcus xinjiangensis]
MTSDTAPDGQTRPVRVTTAGDWPARTWLLLVVLCGALFLDGLDISMVGVALPSLGADLDMSPAALQWIVSGYVLGYGGLLLLGGRAADLLGRRPVFLTAVTVFGLASVASAFLTDDVALIALRFAKGVAAAFTVPAGLSIITTTFTEGPARNRALSIYTVCGASGFSFGLVAGGLLTELGWRATFLVPGPVALLLVLAGLSVVPRSPRRRVSLRQLDLLGATTVTAALLLLVHAVVEAPERGWSSPATWGALLAAAALGALFVRVELRHPQPLVRLGILRSRHLVHANVSGAVMFGGYVAFQFVATLYLQNSLGWSPLAMALGFLPAGLLVVASATRIDRVLARFGTLPLITAGMAAFTLGYALFLRVQPGAGYASFLLPTMLLLGVGFALTFPAVNAQATAGVADSEQGLASGLVNTSIQVGGAVTLAAISAITSTAVAPVPGALLPGMVPAVAVVVALSALGTALGVAMLLQTRRAVAAPAAPEPAPEPVGG